MFVERRELGDQSLLGEEVLILTHSIKSVLVVSVSVFVNQTIMTGKCVVGCFYSC